MTIELPANQCPPHHWEVTLLRLENGLNDHYRCVRCAAEKDVLRGQVSSWSRKPVGRPAKAAS